MATESVADAERVVIVGAGPAGLSTARSYRAHGGTGAVVLVGEEPRLPYERPPLTKEFLRGKVDAASLPIEPEEWFGEHRVKLRLGTRVSAIDPERGVVTLEDGRELSADAIVLATGSEPTRPDVPGMEDPEVLTIRTLPDSERIAKRIDAGDPAIVIGTGFIGCELAASLALRGVQVTLVGQERLPQLDRLGVEAGRRIAVWLDELDIELVGEANVIAIEGATTVELQDGRRLRGSRVVLGAGVRPRGELAQVAGLSTREGAIVVDETMRCTDLSGVVFAVGDVALAHNTSAGRSLRVEHWGDALAHGEVAGQTLAGGGGRWEDVPGFWSTIGEHTLKYAAWGDGYDEARVVDHEGGGFTIWYSRDGAAVGVLTHKQDEDYERGRELIRRGGPTP